MELLSFETADEFWTALRSLIDLWCDQRRLGILVRVLPAYLGFNGLTDGWEDLRKALGDARSGIDVDSADRHVLDRLIWTITKSLQNR